MDDAELRQRLAALHEELESGPDVSDETRQLLGAIIDDIRRLLERRETPATPEEPHSLAERLRGASWQLETSHPRVTGLVEHVVEALTTPFK